MPNFVLWRILLRHGKASYAGKWVTGFEMVAYRGVIISREAIRLWVNRFGAHFAACIRRARRRPNDK